MNNATKKEVKALKITSVDMETIYFDMNIMVQQIIF